jgi:hypothetical protein
MSSASTEESPTDLALELERILLGADAEVLACGCVVLIDEHDEDNDWFLVRASRHVCQEHYVEDAQQQTCLLHYWVTPAGKLVPSDSMGMYHYLRVKTLRGYP